MTEAQKKIHGYLAHIGARGGLASRRELTKSHARQMVAIREIKRAALRAGKPWPATRSQNAQTSEAFPDRLRRMLASYAACDT